MKRIVILLLLLFAVPAFAVTYTSPHHGVTKVDDVVLGGPVIDVRYYGAVADSASAASTNDTAFANAISAVSSSGGTIYVPPDTYYIGTTIDFGTKPIKFIGGGTGAVNSPVDNTRIINTKDADAIRAYNLDKTVIAHLSITSTVGTATTGAGIHIERTAASPGAISAIIDDVYVSDHYYGFHLVRSVLTRVSNCTAEANISHGFYLASTSAGSGTSTLLQSCFANSNGGDGYYVDGYSYITFENTAADSNSNGYSLNKDNSANPTGITFLGVGAESNTLAGIKLANNASITAVSIIGGLLSASGTDGIQTNNAIGVTVVGTKIQLNGDYGVDTTNGATGRVALIKPHFSTNTTGDISDSSNVVLHVNGASNTVTGIPSMQFDAQSSAASTATGTVTYADGTSWGTTLGAGLRQYSGSAWQRFMTVSAESTFGAADTSPSVSGGMMFATLATPSVTIADLDDGVAGQVVVIRATDGAANAADANNLYLVGAWAADSANDTLTLYSPDGTKWIELSRSDVD